MANSVAGRVDSSRIGVASHQVELLRKRRCQKLPRSRIALEVVNHPQSDHGVYQHASREEVLRLVLREARLVAEKSVDAEDRLSVAN